MNPVSERKRAVVLCDSDLLFQAIEHCLGRRLQIDVVAALPEPSDPARAENGRDDLDLIVVGLSAPVGEPVVELARRSLISRLGEVPLLIISDRPFDNGPGDRFAHLSFPFTPDELCSQVERLLQCEPGSSRNLDSTGMART